MPLLDALRESWPAGVVASKREVVDQWEAESLRLYPPGQRYLIGVSGGRDSVVLLHWLLERGYRRLIVCHLDHRLRGRSSAADARFVAKLAEANGLRWEMGRADVRELAAATKQSTETAARSARYAFFAKVARRRRCATIFLGHHADDLVETFLINLFRGAGSQGQRAIREIALRKVAGVELTLLRPLLSVWRTEIDQYVSAQRLRFREDATNQEMRALRNRMRHRIIPQLEKEFGREIRKTVRRAALIAGEEDELLQGLLPASAARLSVSLTSLLPVALQRRAITRWLREQAVSEVSFAMVEAVRSLLETEHGPAKINLTENRHARRRAGELFIE